MRPGRRASSTARDARVKRAAGSMRTGTKRPARKAVGHVAPLYKRLPHGPHRLDRDEVVANQRTRIHGAMIEAVARNGYEGTRVKQVIALAGVSRRSFYEQFANKEGCFLATFDVLARRELQQIRRTYLSCRRRPGRARRAQLRTSREDDERGPQGERVDGARGADRRRRRRVERVLKATGAASTCSRRASPRRTRPCRCRRRSCGP